MALKLPRLFSKQADTHQWLVQDSEIVPYALSREVFLRHIFQKDETQGPTVPQKLAIDVTCQNLQKKEYRRKSIPRLPFIIPRLLKSLRSDTSSAKDYVDIIKKDPVMASAVLKLANSVYFNPIGRRINEIEQAVVKLGIDGLRSVLSAAVMQPIIQKDSAYFSHAGQYIWQHSLTTAVACELIAEHRQLEKFKVYILGLIHDSGTITLFSELSKQFKLNKEDINPGYSAYVPWIKKYAATLSYLIAKDWEIPDDICDALAAQNKIKDKQAVSPYAHVLYQSNMISEIYISIYPKKPEKAKSVLDELGLPIDLFDAFDALAKEI